VTLTAGPEVMSTAPDPDRPRPPGQRLAPLRRAWRQLTSMRTALVLLFLLALAAVPGAFLPQRGQSRLRVDQYYANHPSLAPVLDRLSLFDVYAAPWFAAVYLLLFVSLVGCLVPRIRLHARALRTPPPRVPANLARLPVSARWSTEAEADAVLDAARRTLRGWRVVRRDGALSAERGYLRETGNLLFHVSLVVLLTGIALGGLFGFQGSVLVVEGRGFTNAVFDYDDFRPGRRFAAEDLVPFGFSLDRFTARYDGAGHALDYDAAITWTPDAGNPSAPRRPYDLRVNHPLTAGGARLYLIGHGYAPVVRLTDTAGQVAFEGAVPCLPQNPQFLSSCTIKVPDATGQQYGFEGVFTPSTGQDPATGRVTSLHAQADAPAMTLVGYTGDLGLGTGGSQSVYRLDTSRLTAVGGGTPTLLEPGGTWRLPDGATLSWLDTRQWVTVQVTQDPGKQIALVAAVGMVSGLLMSLFVRRRRVWVRTSPPGVGAGRTVVEVGGLSRTGAETFATEFEALTERLRTGAPSAAGPDSSGEA
jgi:cytochrome c biogenesis protein